MIEQTKTLLVNFSEQKVTFQKLCIRYKIDKNILSVIPSMYVARMGYTIGTVWCYYTKAWYSIGIVEFLKMNYTKYLYC